MAERRDRRRDTPEEAGSQGSEPGGSNPDLSGKDLLPDLEIAADLGRIARGEPPTARDTDETARTVKGPDRSADRDDPDVVGDAKAADGDDAGSAVSEEPVDGHAAPSNRRARRQLRRQQRRRRRRFARARRARPRRQGRARRRDLGATSSDRDAPHADEIAIADEAAQADQGAAAEDGAAAEGAAEGDEEPGERHEEPGEGNESRAVDEPVEADASDEQVGAPPSPMDDFFAAKPAPAPSFVDRLGRGGVALLVLTVLVALAAVAVGLGWLDGARDLVLPPQADVDEEPPPGGWQPALLLLTTVSTDDSAEDLRAVTVVASDRRAGQATVLLIPTATVTDVPGFGSFTLAEAWDFGGSSLVAVTVDNLLGLRIDGVLAADTAAWADWFEAVGGATIEVDSRVVAAAGPDAGSTRFEPGSQQLAPERIAEYLVIRGEGETELQGLPRVQEVVRALSRRIAEDPAGLEAIVEVARTLPGTATPTRIETVLGELAEARTADAATTITLPVVPLGSGEDEVYRPDHERLEALMADRFAASRELGASGERMAVQILNGNARPGVGQEVADALADGRYRIVLTGNADRFTYEQTRILVYTDDREDLEAAQDVRDRLGVGVIERSGTPQSVVDLTIIVGADFPPD